MTDNELKSIQLEILQEFHNFCKMHNLHYSLCAGTLIGAIRHKGYIPWDDDIDVMMPRHDYEIFLSSYHSDIFSIYSHKFQKDYAIAYAKLSHNKTLVIEDVIHHSSCGVNIDIFPLDYFPTSIEKSKEWVRKLKVLKDIRVIKDLKLSRHRSLLKNIFVLIGRFVFCVITMGWLVEKIDKNAQEYYEEKSGFVGNMTNGYGMRERVPIATSLIDVEFEGGLYKAVNNYDVYLRSLFGNYMQLPPIEKQVSHHAFKAYWKD